MDNENDSNNENERSFMVYGLLPMNTRITTIRWKYTDGTTWHTRFNDGNGMTIRIDPPIVLTIPHDTIHTATIEVIEERLPNIWPPQGVVPWRRPSLGELAMIGIEVKRLTQLENYAWGNGRE